MQDDLRLVVGGRAFTGWEAVELTRALECLCGSFNLAVADRPGAPFPVAEGDPCYVYVGEELYLSGYVDAVEASLDAREHSVNVRGRDVAQDLVDCCPIDLPSEFYGLDLLELAQQLASPFGVFVVAQDGLDLGEPFERFSRQLTETAHEALERACRMRGVLATSTPSGLVQLTRAGTELSTGSIEEGVNLRGARYSSDRSGRFRRYVVLGQTPGSDTEVGAACSESLGEAQDPVPRASRTLALTAEGNVDSAGAELRAAWECNVRAARASKLACTLQGWRQSRGGLLWRPNLLVAVRCPTLRVEGDWLVSAVKLRRDPKSGTVTELALSRPDAFVPEPPKPEGEVPFGADVGSTPSSWNGANDTPLSEPREED